MTERPILFSAPMVRAILDGRKFQTRRILKHGHASEIDDFADMGGGRWDLGVRGDGGAMASMGWMRCPFGVPGDRLWLRETWAHDGSKAPPVYRADWECKRDPPGVRCEHGPDRWRPSIFMPRWACRTVLEITSVRVERLQSISEADAKAEGVHEQLQPDEHGRFRLQPPLFALTPDMPHQWGTAKRAFQDLWESINGAGSWAKNPWVWVVSFRRLP